MTNTINPSTLSYIGVGTSPKECWVSLSFKNNIDSGKYLLVRLWKSEKMSYVKLVEKIIEFLKIREQNLSEQTLKTAKKYQYDAIWHNYTIISNEDPVLESKLSEINLQYTKPLQQLHYELHDPLIDLHKSLTITSGLINDGLVRFHESINKQAIQREIESSEAEKMGFLSPQLTAITHSLGEAEFRKLNDKEPFNASAVDIDLMYKFNAF